MKKALLLAAIAWLSVGIAASSNFSARPIPTVVSHVGQQLAQAPTPATAARPAAAQTPQPRPVQAPAAAPAGPVAMPAEYKQMVTRYCVSCHNERLALPATNPLRLDTANFDDPAKDAAIWEKVIRRLDGVASMPPLNNASPGREKLRELRTWLETDLDRAAGLQQHPGQYVLHRLNRTEYANAVRDLLGIDVDVTEFLPSDGGDFGFDNVATALPTSPLLLERYLTAAMRISDLAVGDPKMAPGATVYPVGLETTQQEHVPGLPLGTRGGVLVHHIFPADGDYLLSVRLNRTILNGYSGLQGNEKPQTYIVVVDGKQVFTEKVGGPEDHRASVADVNVASVAVFERLKVRVTVTAGAHDVGFTWLDTPLPVGQDVWQPSMRDTQEVHMAGGVPRIRGGVIEGPYNVTGVSNTASRDRIFVCRPATAVEESACAQRIVSTLSRRAFRRAVTASDTEAPMAFYTRERKNGGNFDAGIRAAVARVLSSPSFVYRSESDPETLAAGAAHRVSDVELASRLSFFLWSSVPDDQLLNLAIAGRLREPGVLAAQVKRMIADERANALVSNFTGQWLQLRNLEARVAPDILMFPDFDDNVRKGFRKETELFFASILQDDRSMLRLLDADWTFLNERLAKHYGISGVYGDRFRRVQLTDPNRRGLLGQGSLLSLTAVANRTSPTIRGKYVLAVLLNAPPPPPLPVVPALEKSQTGKPMTVRQTVELHRANPVCAACHKNIDPVGFALENFDSTGVWRDKTVDGLPIDAVGSLPDGREVNGPVQLREALLARPDLFVNAVTENMMIYALGRGLEPIDMPVVRSIVRSAAKNDYRFQSVIMGIVQSAPFQMRTKLAPADAGKKVAQN